MRFNSIPCHKLLVAHRPRLKSRRDTMDLTIQTTALIVVWMFEPFFKLMGKLNILMLSGSLRLNEIAYRSRADQEPLGSGRYSLSVLQTNRALQNSNPVKVCREPLIPSGRWLAVIFWLVVA